MSSLSRRFSRQIKLLGREGQKKLGNSTALILGVGGLGSFEALLLAYTGIGRLILVDSDAVDESNLNRQVLHWTTDIGRPKVFSAREKLEKINPEMVVEAYFSKISRSVLESLVPRADVVLDGLDNWETRLLADEVAWKYGKPFIHAGVEEYYGQVVPVKRGESPCLRCIIPFGDLRQREVQVLGSSVSIIASIAVFEAIKIIAGISKPSYGKMIFVDLLEPAITVIDVSRAECRC